MGLDPAWAHGLAVQTANPWDEAGLKTREVGWREMWRRRREDT